MNKNRLEIFSDGVIAIIITIMVLELKAPHGTMLSDLMQLLPAFVSYVLSFMYLAIYWNNHHHMLHATQHIDGRIMWANLHLLFWLSLIPFTTAWMGENNFAATPTALYGFVLLMAAIAYSVLQNAILRHRGHNLLAKAVGRDFKGKISPILYALAIPAAFLNEWISCAVYIGVALLWILPDPRIEQIIDTKK